MQHLDKQRIFEVLNTPEFICTFSGHSRADRDEHNLPQRAVLRSLGSGDERVLQLNTFTEKQHFSTTLEGTLNGLNEALDQCLSQRFMQVHVQRPDYDWYLRRNATTLTAKRTKPSLQQWGKVTQHDHKRNYLINEQNAADLLRVLRMSNEKGAVIPAMQAKFRQINHFLGLATNVDAAKAQRLRIIDCGCGRAYLSLALYHVLSNLHGKEVELIGIDNNPELVAQCNAMAQELGYSGAHFVHSAISDFKPEAQSEGEAGYEADIVIALHACDTATDDALALALRLNAKAILAAPCCHHYVNERLRAANVPAAMAPLLRDGIARERFADLLTDTMRRDILRSYGYSAELIEFVAQEHTMKNIMIRAEKNTSTAEQRGALIKNVQEEQATWNVAPKLLELLKM